VGYQQWWKTLETLIATFRQRRLDIPPDIMTSLRSAKTLISVYGADTARPETLPMIESQLLAVESTLINTAKDTFGAAFADEWLRKLDRARNEEESPADTPAARFVTGLPRDEHWIRVLPSDTLLREDVERLAAAVQLATSIQADGYILVHGREDRVRDFIRKMAEKCRRPPAHAPPKDKTPATPG
jgi:hypothetical protein